MNEGARFGTTMHFQKSVQGPDAYTRPLEGKIKGREVRPGWGTVGALFLHTFHPAHCDVREHGATSRTRRFRNLFNVYRTSRSIRDEQRG